jgi:inorganic pyrophosphatase
MTAETETGSIGKELFWTRLDEILHSSEVIIDRPQGKAHPDHPAMVYPLDYGYLAGTSSPDGREIDVWLGSLPEKKLDAVICTVDLLKKDAEIKLILGCTEREKSIVCRFLNGGGYLAGILIRRDPE